MKIDNYDDCKSLAKYDERHHLHPMTNPFEFRKNGPDIIRRAEGIYLFLEDGRKMMDLSAGLANVSLGYGNRRLCAAAFEAMKELSYCHSIVGRSNHYVAALSAKLAAITPRQFNCFFFASSGSEANESAIKLALHYWRLRGKPEKRITLARRGSYHGSTMMTASLTGQALFHEQFGLPFSDLVHHIDSTNWYQEGKGRTRTEFYQKLLESLEKHILEVGPHRIAALIGEPIQTGIIIPDPLYWRGVRALCDRYDILLIADEVVTGFGKTGKMFGFENFDYEPDLISVAKALTSGYFPLSAVCIGERVSQVVLDDNAVFAHVFTNSGNPVGSAVALATLQEIEDNDLLNRVRSEIEPHFSHRLNGLLEYPCIRDVRYLGTMGAFEVDASNGARTSSAEQDDALRSRIVANAWRHGLIIRGGTICLPMTIDLEEIDWGMRRLSESIAEAIRVS